MILFTSAIKTRLRMNRSIIIYGAVSIFCLILFIIYDRFSHNVRSPFMTWLFLWPFLLGVLPALLLQVFPLLPRPSFFSRNAYNSGVAAVTVSSMLRGIFEIAGTASVLQTGLMIAGFAMILAGLVSYVISTLSSPDQGVPGEDI